MKKLIETTEHSSIQLQYKLNSHEREYLYKLSCKNNDQLRTYRFHFEEYGNQLNLKTVSWVGVIELASMRIEIRPKFNRGFTSLVDMICFINRIPFYKWHDTSATYTRDDLIELLVRLFLAEVEKLMKYGLVKEYVSEEDNLQQLRGRLIFDKNLKKNKVNPTRIYCGYDELVTNIPENQIVLSAIELAYRFRLRDNTKRQLNMYRCEFEKVCEPISGNDWPVFHYHRLNAHYEKAHRLSGYILKHTSVSEIFNYRQQSFFSILIDMNELFEKFLSEIFIRYLPKFYKVETGKRILDALMKGGHSYRHIIPDIVVKNTLNNRVTVLDAKYKPYGFKPIDTADLFQISFYGQYFNQKKDKGYHSFIVYPVYSNEKKKRFLINLLPTTSHWGDVIIEGLEIEKTIERIKGNQLDHLQALALNLSSWSTAANEVAGGIATMEIK